MNIEKQISKKINCEGKSQILLKLTLSRVSRPRIKSNIFIKPSLFKIKSSTVHGNLYDICIPKMGKQNFLEVKEATDSKNALDELINRLNKLFSDNIINASSTKEQIEEILFGNSEQNKISNSVIKPIVNSTTTNISNNDFDAKYFSSLIDEYCKLKKLTKRRVDHFSVLARNICRYEQYQRLTGNRNFKFDYNKITKDDLQDFLSYMQNEINLVNDYPELFKKIFEITNPGKNIIIKQRGDNYMSMKAKTLAAIFNWLFETGKTANRPMIGVIRPHEQYGNPIFLTIQERNQIASFDLSDNRFLETQRDIFIFQCLIGCRVSDLIDLSEDKIQDGILEYVPSKTEKKTAQNARVPLNKQALELIDKYRGIDSSGRLFPFITPQKYNDAIKKIFEKCKIDRKVQVRNSITGKFETKSISEIASSHMARRTFAGAAYRVVKDPNIVCKMTGHVEGSKAFLRYRTVDDDMLKDVIDAIS